MRRHTVQPYGQGTTLSRLGSMLMVLAVLAALYSRLRDPDSWSFLIEDRNATAQESTRESPEPVPEEIVEGLNDLDADEVESARKQFEFLVDRIPLKSREMNAYWKLMDWSRTQSFADLEERAAKDVAFTQIWEQPDDYRGKLIRLKLHVRRIIEFKSPENPSSIPKVYEAWGWTDESRSFPYVVVFPDLPEGVSLGTDIRTEFVFVGYFLKIMSYTAFDHTRGAPLLIGRVQSAEPQIAAERSSESGYLWTAIAAISLLGLVGYLIQQFRRKPVPRESSLPDSLTNLDQIQANSGNAQSQGTPDHPSESPAVAEFDFSTLINAQAEHSPEATLSNSP